jgi:glycerol uptake facilitator protein
MFLAEMLGTMVLILLGNGVVANVVLNKSKGQNSGWIVITAGWAFAVMCGAFVSGALGGPGSLNPAGVIQGFIGGGGDIGQGLQMIAGQFVGAFFGAILVWLAYRDHFDATPDGGAKLACFSTGPAIKNPVNNLITEIIGTFALIFIVNCIFKAAGDTLPGGLGPYLVGALIWGLGLSLGGPTGYALNPARDLGPRIAHAILPLKNKGDSDWSYAWIPVVGPIIGAILGGVVFRTLVG